MMYTITFTFTNPGDPTDIRFLKTKDLTKADVIAWLRDIFYYAYNKIWLISNVTIAKQR